MAEVLFYEVIQEAKPHPARTLPSPRAVALSTGSSVPAGRMWKEKKPRGPWRFLGARATGGAWSYTHIPLARAQSPQGSMVSVVYYDTEERELEFGD